MPRTNPDGPARHSSLASAFQLANATYVQHLETKPASPGASPPTPTNAPARRPKREPPVFEPITAIEEKFRHGFWQSRRKRISEALLTAGTSGHRRENFANCGSNCYVTQEQKSGEIRLTATRCHDRFCLPCQQERARRIQRALHKRVPLHRTLFVVLTAASNDLPLGQQLTALYAAAAKLRGSRFWKRRVIGGFQCFECTWNASTKRWHPHLHILAHADWIPQAELSAEWLKCTKTASVVHVSLVENSPAAIAECTKYLAQPVHRSIQFVADRLVELMTALKGRRLCTTFGTWRSDPLLQEDEAADEGDWRPVLSLHSLVTAAAKRDTWAMHALRYLESRRHGRTEIVPPPPLSSA